MNVCNVLQSLPADFDAAAVLAEMAELRQTVKTQESRITELESRLAALEAAANTESDEADGAAAKDSDD